MKKILCLCLAVLLSLFVFTGCLPILLSVAGDKDDDTSTISPSEKSDEPEETVKPTDTTTKPATKPAPEVPEESENMVSGETTVDEQVIVDQDGIKITVKEYVSDTIWGDGIKLLVENNTDLTATVSCRGLVVNNYIVNDVFSETIAAGKKVNSTLDLPASELEEAGIADVGLVEVLFYVYDSDTYDELFETGLLPIKTSEYDNMEIVACDDGLELYNNGGVRIVGKHVNHDDIFGASVLLYLENMTDKNIQVSVGDMSVNGFMVDGVFSSMLYPGKMAIDDITIFSTDLEENGIETIEEIELIFKIRDPDTYDLIAETAPIAVQVDKTQE